MSGEEQQEQAALHALGLLTADEAAAFEKAMQADPALAALTRELRETANLAVLAIPAAIPPAGLRARVLARMAAEAAPKAGDEPSPGKIVPFRLAAWLPWAVAAGLAIFCGVLASDLADLRRELVAAQAADPLAQVAVYTLDPTSGPKAAAVAVAWNPARQTGLLRLSGLPAAGTGQDYQLWAVDAAHKEPISAGVVTVDAKGRARLEFKPDLAAPHVGAFAISLEPAGGSPKKTGPIVFIGTE